MPGVAGTTVSLPVGMVRPSRPRSRTMKPFVPVSSSSYCCSRPAVPLPSGSVAPTMERATSPAGMKRFGSSSA